MCNRLPVLFSLLYSLWTVFLYSTLGPTVSSRNSIVWRSASQPHCLDLNKSTSKHSKVDLRDVSCCINCWDWECTHSQNYFIQEDWVDCFFCFLRILKKKKKIKRWPVANFRAYSLSWPSSHAKYIVKHKTILFRFFYSTFNHSLQSSCLPVNTICINITNMLLINCIPISNVSERSHLRYLDLLVMPVHSQA